MRTMPKISEAEWEVMKALWEKSPLTANEIVETLSKRTSWQRETIRTLINRLVQKKAVGFQQEGRQYHYSPRVGEAECIKEETRSLLRRFGGTSIEPMLAAFVEERRLSPEQIERLKQILEGAQPDTNRRQRKHNP